MVDRILSKRHDVLPSGPSLSIAFNVLAEKPMEQLRKQQYSALRLNMPVVEVVPSLDPRQEYEARVRIVGHTGRRDEDIPIRVTWSAGPKFANLAACDRAANPDFSAVFGYWDNVLIQARLEFAKGDPAVGYVYAWLPE